MGLTNDVTKFVDGVSETFEFKPGTYLCRFMNSENSAIQIKGYGVDGKVRASFPMEIYGNAEGEEFDGNKRKFFPQIFDIAGRGESAFNAILVYTGKVNNFIATFSESPDYEGQCDVIADWLNINLPSESAFIKCDLAEKTRKPYKYTDNEGNEVEVTDPDKLKQIVVKKWMDAFSTPATNTATNAAEFV